MIRLGLLPLVPVAPILLCVFGLPPLWVSVAGIAAVGVLADWIRAATENVAQHTGPAVGGRGGRGVEVLPMPAYPSYPPATLWLAGKRLRLRRTAKQSARSASMVRFATGLAAVAPVLAVLCGRASAALGVVATLFWIVAAASLSVVGLTIQGAIN